MSKQPNEPGGWQAEVIVDAGAACVPRPPLFPHTQLPASLCELTAVKILYTIDTSPQSYLAVLPERQDVYVHPVSQGMMFGSCTLKALARGICFAR